ncbi:MAG TPA: DUF4230 domain-containing protein [Gemmatimonadaceae bacterium]|nr:DUF4230 domain-containing protein [Gemmatimonadaceae bacterium]
MTRKLALVAALLVLLLTFAYAAVRRQAGVIGDLLGGRERTSVSHSMIVDKVRAVAKLVTSETTIRDVVVYKNTWYGSTKQSLVVVTGRLLAGIDMNRGADVKVDDAAKRIEITLPKAGIMALEISDMQTYDERGGLWNPFTPADRDNILRLARGQIMRSATSLNVTAHAEKSAADLLTSLFSTDGYTASVRFVPQLQPVDGSR